RELPGIKPVKKPILPDGLFCVCGLQEILPSGTVLPLFIPPGSIKPSLFPLPYYPTDRYQCA
ncbi:hypothetical protein, partial [Citrobacter sp. FR21SANT8218]|uniref:hypothetical protein n=1 Tax=Citrobacter sp. FR21SANT8218 TaxID=3381296 RepID=UPI003A984745